MAAASLVLGITSIVFCWMGILTLLQLVLAFVFGFRTLSRADRWGVRAPLAVAGTICASVGLLIYFAAGALTAGLFWIA